MHPEWRKTMTDFKRPNDDATVDEWIKYSRFHEDGKKDALKELNTVKAENATLTTNLETANAQVTKTVKESIAKEYNLDAKFVIGENEEEWRTNAKELSEKFAPAAAAQPKLDADGKPVVEAVVTTPVITPPAAPAGTAVTGNEKAPGFNEALRASIRG
jgi:hypothetical protein